MLVNIVFVTLFVTLLPKSLALPISAGTLRQGLDLNLDQSGGFALKKNNIHPQHNRRPSQFQAGSRGDVGFVAKKTPLYDSEASVLRRVHSSSDDNMITPVSEGFRKSGVQVESVKTSSTGQNEDPMATGFSSRSSVRRQRRSLEDLLSTDVQYREITYNLEDLSDIYPKEPSTTPSDGWMLSTLNFYLGNMIEIHSFINNLAKLFTIFGLGYIVKMVAL